MKRYAPIKQIPYCCVPASLQMVLLRRRLPIIDQETIGERLGLVTPERYASDFRHDHSGRRPLTGYGTRIDLPRFSLGNFFSSHGLPLRMEHIPRTDVTRRGLLASLAADDDLLACIGDDEWGHVVAIESTVGKVVSIDDPELGRYDCSYRELVQEFRPAARMGGIWRITDR